MSDISFAPQQKKNSLSATSKNKTPRLIRTQTRGKYSYYSQSKILPSIAAASNTELNHTSLLKTLFNAFIETLNKLLSHNSASANFRYSISSQSQEAQRLFGVFFQQAFKHFGSSPVLQRGARPSESITNGIIQSSFLPFLKTWNSFACNCCKLQELGPDAIMDTIKRNFDIILESLESVLHHLSKKNMNIHNTSTKVVNRMKKHALQLSDDSVLIIQTPDDSEKIKETAEKVKSFSRSMNDLFTKDLENCGLGTYELIELRQKTYTSCCNIISALKASYLFSQDMTTLLGALDEFQDCLIITLEHLDLPTSYIYSRNVLNKGVNSPRLEEDNEEEESIFEECNNPSELCECGLKNIHLLCNKIPTLNSFLSRLKEVSMNSDKEIKELEKETETEKNRIQDVVQKAEDDKKMNDYKVSELESEIKRLKDICSAQEKEIEKLQVRKNDNAFKKCLRDVAKKLGGVLQEEEANIIPDDEDDQLIAKVDALTVYVVERKCQKCVLHDEEEKKMRSILSVVVDSSDKDIPFYDVIKLVRERFESLSEECDKMKNRNLELEQDCNYLQNGYKQILGMFNEDSNDFNDIVGVTINTIRQKFESASREISAVAAAKDKELNDFADSIIRKLNNFVEQKPEGTSVQKASMMTTNAIVRIRQMEDRFNKGILNKAESRDILAKLLGVKPPISNDDETILNLVKQLEAMPNPLNETLKAANKLNKFMMSSIEVINNRFRGVSMSQSIKPSSSMQPEALVSTTVKMLEEFQDIHEETEEKLFAFKQRYEVMRTALENMDLKLHKFLGQEDVDLTLFSDSQLIDRADSFVSNITNKQVSPDFIAKNDIDILFRDVYDLVPVTTRSDPMKYIPEVNNAFISLNESIMKLKPFADALNNVFSKFDCKLDSFIPGSTQCNYLRQQILHIHSILNRIVPSKMNSLVFLVISRFTALVSSFFSALTAMSYSPDDEHSKKFLFSLQQENERLNSILESNGISY